MHCQKVWEPGSQNRTSEISNNALSGILRLLCAEQGVGNLKKWTFWNSGTPGRKTERRKSRKLHYQELWDSCAQNKTSEISTNALSGIMGLLGAEQDAGNLNKNHFQEFWDSCAQNKTSEISTNALSGILGLLGA